MDLLERDSRDEKTTKRERERERERGREISDP